MSTAELPPIGTLVTVDLANYRGMTGRVIKHQDSAHPVVVEFNEREAYLRDVRAREAFSLDEIEVAS